MASPEHVSEESGQSSMPFPSLEPEESPSTSPNSNATVLTSSDKLSALPATPKLNNRRSPIHGHGHSPRLFRHSLDASRSWPSISQSGNNLESFAQLSPALPDGNRTWHSRNESRPRASISEGSLIHQTPRASTESERTSLPTMQSVKHALKRLRQRSDPPSPALRGDYANQLEVGSRSPSHSRSRATSPLRIFQQWSQGIHHRPHMNHHEEPFVPVDPFQSQFRFRVRPPRFRLPGCLRMPLAGKTDNTEGLPMKTHDASRPSTTAHRAAFDEYVNNPGHEHHDMRIFFLDTLPRVIYLHLLLRIPSMYFSRVARIFEDAEVSKPDIHRMIEACGRGGSHFLQTQNSLGPGPNNLTVEANANTTMAPNNISNTVHLGGTGLGPGPASGNTTATNIAAAVSVVDLPLPSLPFPNEWSTTPFVSPALVRFKLSWETFIDSLMREWKTLNVVSALLLSAILTIFQINNAATDPITRTAALLSLVCAIMSLSYGCMYIVRFGTMRSMYRASIWAEEAQKTETLVWWNVWVLLGMPAVWMAWSMIFFIASILSFVWRTDAQSDPDDWPPLSDQAALGPRVAITVVFGIGMMYFALIVKTLSSYGPNGIRGREQRKNLGVNDIEAQVWDTGDQRGHHTRRKSSLSQTRNITQIKSSRTHRTNEPQLHDVVVDTIHGRGRDRDRTNTKAPRRSRRNTSDDLDIQCRPVFGLDFGLMMNGEEGEGESGRPEGEGESGQPEEAGSGVDLGTGVTGGDGDMKLS
ncbi:hypothetical protein BDP27DRAFT_1316661 [Rhodocollybia butyracea]|uniref:Uncharacterized protein n=1 Tax=Rhodocollybia butyracea TaxID=206335 RepID=A0A9P5UD07_9AGAR|nr:hypothetical protein BDP27DRAFT_1316661 [Rhodocollybia butyracea]